MSETTKTGQINKKRRTIFFVVILIVVFLLLVYGGGIIVLPISVLYVYKDKDCDLVLARYDIYTNIYPAFLVDKTLIDPVMECAVYTLANLKEGEEVWRDSYNAFEVYSASYPNGLFVKEAHEHSAVVLTGLAKEQIAGRLYKEALGNLNVVIVDYSDTRSISNANDLFPEIYTAWGTDLRSSGKFTEAEQVFHEFKAWSESNQKTALATSAQHELAQTYLDWGLALQSQKQFEDANKKFSVATLTDPEPQANSGPASQVKANQAKFYGEWGDYLVEQKEFAQAIEQYKLAASLPENTNPSVALDGIANIYIQWSEGLSATEDFLGALKQVDLAQENAATDAMKKSVEDARSGIYLAFSNSRGEQAQQAMKDAASVACELNEKPDLPIFGLDKGAVLASVHGIETQLPKAVSVTTPGALHYVVCIKVTEKTIQFVDFYGFLMARIKVFWDVSLYNMETGDVIETYYLEGQDPPALPTNAGAIVAGGKNQRYFGGPPNIADLADWLLTVMK